MTPRSSTTSAPTQGLGGACRRAFSPSAIAMDISSVRENFTGRAQRRGAQRARRAQGIGLARRSPSRRPGRWRRRAPRRGAVTTSMPPSTSMSRARVVAVDLAPGALDLVHDVGDEGLAAEAREDRHQEQQVDVAEERRDGVERACRGSRPDRRAARARAPRSISCAVSPTSTCTVQPSAPARAKASR